jgi:hypothetical protein
MPFDHTPMRVFNDPPAPFTRLIDMMGNRIEPPPMQSLRLPVSFRDYLVEDSGSDWTEMPRIRSQAKPVPEPKPKPQPSLTLTEGRGPTLRLEHEDTILASVWIQPVWKMPLAWELAQKEIANLRIPTTNTKENRLTRQKAATRIIEKVRDLLRD